MILKELKILKSDSQLENGWVMWEDGAYFIQSYIHSYPAKLNK